MLNRSAVVIRYREAFRDRLRSIGVDEEEFEDHAERSVYLVGECEYPEDQEEVVRLRLTHQKRLCSQVRAREGGELRTVRSPAPT